MTRIDQVMRELSDMRSFYLKLQQSKRTSLSGETEAVAEAPADYNTEGSSDSFESDARERAGLLRQQASEGGLKFEAYLPSGLAEWVLYMVEKGIFRDPAEAVFVYMQKPTGPLGPTFNNVMLECVNLNLMRPINEKWYESGYCRILCHINR